MNNNELFLIIHIYKVFNKDFNFDMIKLFCFKSISFPVKPNTSNFSNFTFSNTFIFDILLKL